VRTARHERPRDLFVPFLIGDADHTWTNQPVGETFLLGSNRHVTKVDLTDYTEVRLVVRVLGVAANSGATMQLKFRTSFSTGVFGYSTFANTAVSIDATNTITDSGWVSMPSVARADVFVAPAGLGGDGAIDPEFGSVAAHFR